MSTSPKLSSPRATAWLAGLLIVGGLGMGVRRIWPVGLAAQGPAESAPATEPDLPPDPAFAQAAASERVADYPTALERAAATGNDLLVLQRGSDWNRLGEDFHRHVWQQDAFLRSLGPGFILVEVDRPEFPGAPSLLAGEAERSAIARFRAFTREAETEPPPSTVAAVQAQSGAVYQPREDGSWRVQPGSGPAPTHDTLTLTVRLAAGTTVLRLDFPPDDSLPNRAAGRASNGNFALTEITAASPVGPLPLRAAWASHAEGGGLAAHLLDGAEDQPDLAWNPGAHTGRRRVLALALAEPLAAEGEVTLTLAARSKWSAHIPGCLRVAGRIDTRLAEGLARHAEATALAARNAAFDWLDKGQVPRLALLDAQGRSLAAENHPRPPLSPLVFARRVRELRDVRLRRDAHWAQAEKASGPAKAEALRQGLDVLGLANSRGNGKRYQPIHEAIKAADPEDVSGATRWLGFSADPKGSVPWAKPTWSEALDTQKGKITLTDEHYREALARVDKELADPRKAIMPAEYIQRMMVAKFHIYKRWKGHEDDRFEVQRQIAALDPETFWGIGARGYLGQYKRSPTPYLSYGWGPAQIRPGRQTWDLTDTAYFFAQPVPHRITLTHRGGKLPLRIHRLALLEGDQVLSEATPNRLCGPGADAKVECELEVPAGPPERRLTLRVEVESEVETADSTGSFAVEPIFREDLARTSPARRGGTARRALAARLLPEIQAGDTPSRLAEAPRRAELAQHELLRRVGDEAESLLARPGGAKLLAALTADPAWLEDLLVCTHRDWAQVLENLRFLHRNTPGFDHPVYRRLGTAMALQAGKMNRYRLQDRFTHIQQVHQTGLLHAQFDTLSIREMTWAVWLAGTREDFQFMVDDFQTTWADYLGACWRIPYIDPNVYGYSVQGWGYVDPWVHHYGNGSGDRPYRIQRTVGGVCGTLSGYGAASARAHGVMATTVGQPGHCAYVVRVEDRWNTGNDVSGPETNGASVFEGTGFPSMHRLYEVIHADRERLVTAARALWAANLRLDRHRTEVRVRPGLTFRQYRLPDGKLDDLAQGVLEKSGPAEGFDLAAAAPASTEHLGVVWEGEVEILGAGQPRVRLTANDLARLRLGGQVMASGQGWQDVALGPGVHPVRLEYGNKAGRHQLQVEWSDRKPFDPEWYAAARRALQAQPENLAHWLEVAQALEAAEGVPVEVWREAAPAAARAFAAWHEAGWSLVNRFLTKGREGLSPAALRAALVVCHQHLRQENAPHFFGYNLGAVLDTHVKWLGEPAEQVAYFKEILRGHDSARKDAQRVFGEVLAWGQRRLGGQPATAALFIPALDGCFPVAANGGVPARLSELILRGLREASERHDPVAHRLWRDLAVKRLPVPGAADLFLTATEYAAAPQPEPFPGSLVSAEASLRLSSASPNDRPLAHGAVLDGGGPGFFETNPEEKPWVQVQLAGEVEPSGIVVVNRYESPAGQDRFTRSFPFVVLASTDGKEWTEVARVETPAPFVRIDLTGKIPRVKYLRLERASATPARKMHFRNVRMYGRKLY
jgi:hypothetical protein